MADVQDKIDAAVPGLHVATAQLMEDLIGDLTAVPEPIEVKLYAANPAALAPAARKLAAAVAKVQGVVSVQDGIVIAGDGLNIQVDPARAAIEGVDAQFVSDALQSYLQGTVATQMPQATKQVGVRVWLPPGQRQRDDQLADLPIRAPDGHVFALSRVAQVSAAPGQAEITRENLQLMIPITARLQGVSLGTAVADVKAVLGPGRDAATRRTLRVGRPLRAAADRLRRPRAGVRRGAGGRVRGCCCSCTSGSGFR